jgi:hypothetical protein
MLSPFTLGVMMSQQQTPQQVQNKKETKAALKYQRDKDREKVRGIFRFHEVPGGQMSFVFKGYREDPVERFELIDGQVYTVPLGVAKHLNKNGWYPVHQYAVDGDGKSIMQIGQKVRRFSFQSLEFIDSEDLTPVGTGQIITVENI